MGSLGKTDDVAMTEVPITEAIQVCQAALEKAGGYPPSDAEIITQHLVDAECRGSPMAGLARALSIIDHLQKSPGPTKSSKDIETTSEGPTSVKLNGCNVVGYLVAHRATELAIEKAKASGMAIVGANDFWYSGNLAYFAEMATKHDMISVIFSNCSPMVAPEGAVEGRFGTNPMCIGFPTSLKDRPVIWDIGTSNIMHAQIMRAQRLGISLPEGAAYTKDGQPTTDPATAIDGAMTVWGGHKGSGLAVMIQLLGMAAGSSARPEGLSGFGYLVMMFDPAVLRPIDEVKQEADEYAEWLRSAKPLDGGPPVRMPFNGSYERRKTAVERGTIRIPTVLMEQLRKRGAT
ncbi:malate/L-lactate dehydrogenase [Exophiala viscosa]|uniref:malate/L-lactate dehydrogenase n=1 Tax=Exophiala viscosa TaxID=2486360 RepID=UPI0021923E33|nr:malate/L-lactate dehydrogenase [Exophiala viscosa]